jgi:hypothetical protein
VAALAKGNSIEIQKQAVDLDEEMFGVALHRRWGRGSGSSMSWAG